MWRTPSGIRILTGPEAVLVRAAIGDMTDTLQEEADGLADEWPCGVRLFDELSWQQRLALLARVATALFKSEVPPPELTAVNEATVAALFAHVERNVWIELDNAREIEPSDDFDIYYWRRMIAACQELPPTDEDFVEEKSVDIEDWQLVIECCADRILWDADWDMPDLFMDAEPALSRKRRQQLGIIPDYFTTPAPDLREQDVPKAFAGLHQLLDDGE